MGLYTLVIVAITAITSFFGGWFLKNHTLESTTKQVLEEIKRLLKQHKAQLSYAYSIYNMTEHKEQLRQSNESVIVKIRDYKLQLQELEQEYKDKKYFIAEQNRKISLEKESANTKKIDILKSKSNRLKTDK